MTRGSFKRFSTGQADPEWVDWVVMDRYIHIMITDPDCTAAQRIKAVGRSLTVAERRAVVVRLWDQGKTFTEIARIVAMNHRDIGLTLKAEGRALNKDTG